MTGLDTNVVIRYVTRDEPSQFATAARLIDSFSVEKPGFLSLVVIVELAWVLEVSYRFTKAEIVEVLEALLRSKELIAERAEIVWQALRDFAAGNADFADCLIERCGNSAGCQHTFTFDQRAARIPGMRLLK